MQSSLSPAIYCLTMRLFETLATRRQHPSAKAGATSVFVTSARRREGRTFIAQAISAHLSEMTDDKTLLVDADVENSSLHKIFAIENKEGFTDCLAGDDPGKAQISPGPFPNLDIITIGQVRKPGLVFKRARLSSFINRHSPHYGIILFDGGVLETSGCLPHQTDGTILVVDSNSTRREVIQGVMARTKLPPERYLGAVLNKCVHYIPRFVYKLF